MKRTTLVIMLLAVLVVSCLALTACQHSCEFGEWIVIEQATCTEAGLKVQVCECGESKAEIIPAGHSYTSVVTAPTCTERGYTTHTCHCGQRYKDTYVDATGHSHTAVVTEPTCAEQGYTTHTCTCGDSYIDTYVDAIAEANGAHNFQQSDVCEYCGQNIVDVAVESFDMSATSNDNIRTYVVPRRDGNYDAYIIGTGGMKDFYRNSVPFKNDGNKLANVYIANSVTTIGDYAFYGCSSLTGITIPDDVTTIGNHAFDGCSSLTSMVIPNSVTSIGWSAFSGCTSLTSITIPDSVTSIGSYAFDECSSLTSIMVDEENTVYHSAGNCLIETATKTLILGCKNSVIPGDGSVTSIGSYAFYGCYGLTSITIPDSVINIGDYAFNGCSSLTSITIPEGVFSIGYYAFSDCTSLTTVIFEDPNGWCYTRKDGSWGKNFSLTNTSKNADYFTDTHCDCNWYKNN